MANIYELPLPDGSIVQVEGEREPTREEWMRAIGPQFSPSTPGRLPVIADPGLLAAAQRKAGEPETRTVPLEFALGPQADTLSRAAYEAQQARTQAGLARREASEQMVKAMGVRVGVPLAATMALVGPGTQATVPAILGIGAAGALGEAGGQLIEGRNPTELGNLPELVAAGVLAPVGAGSLTAGRTTGQAVLQGLKEGVGVAAGSEAARAVGQTIRGEGYSPDAATALNFALGAGLGAGARGIEARATPPKIEPAPSNAAGEAAQAASQIKQSGGASSQATLTQLSLGAPDAGLMNLPATEIRPSPVDNFFASNAVRQLETEQPGIATMRRLNEEAAAETPRGKAGTLRDLLSAEEEAALRAQRAAEATPEQTPLGRQLDDIQERIEYANEQLAAREITQEEHAAILADLQQPNPNALQEPIPSSVSRVPEAKDLPKVEEEIRGAEVAPQAQAQRIDSRQLLRQRAAERGMIRQPAPPSSPEAPISPAIENVPAIEKEPTAAPALTPKQTERLGFLDRKFARTSLSEAEEAERASLRSAARASGQAGFASGPVLSGLSGSGAGGAAGYLSTERQEGESEEAFNARRLAATVGGALAGGAATVAAAEVLGRTVMPKPNRADPSLPNDLLDVVNRTEQKAPIGKRLESLYLDARYNLDSKSSAIRHVQRKLADNLGKSVTFGGVNDLGAAYESLPGSVARAGKWIRALDDVVRPVPKQARPWMETLVAGRRVLSRLESNERANVRLLDELQEAQLNLDTARKANADYDKFLLDERQARTEYSNARKAAAKDPTPDNWQAYWQAEFEYNQARQARIDNAEVARGLESAKDRVAAANSQLKEGFDRKRTGKFGLPGEAGKTDIAEQLRKTEDTIRSKFGQPVLDQINQSIDLYQGVMRGGLQDTVKAGLLSPEAYRRIIADNDFYAPFAVLREIDEEVKRAGPAGKIGGIASSAAVTRAIKGISNPDFKLDNIFSVSAEQLFNNSIRGENNRFMRRFATLSRQDPSGEYIARLGADEKPRAGYEVITYLDGGTPRRLEVIPEIARVLGSVEPQNADAISKAIRTGGNVFKLAVTGVNPFFQAANYAFYDPIRANIFSRYGLGQRPLRYAAAPIYMLTDAVPALFSSARANLLGQQDELYKRAIDSGVLSGVFARYLRPKAFKATLPSNRSAIEILKDNKFGIDPIMDYWGRIGAVLEEATKIEGTKRAARWHMIDTPSGKKIPLGEAEKLMGASAPAVEKAWKEAAYDVRNYYGSPDFSVRGAALNSLATFFPFAPAVQRAVIADFQKAFPVAEASRAVRGKAFDRKRLGEAAATWGRMLQVFGLPALGVAAINALPENKKDYERLPDYVREGYVNIPLYETTFKDGSVRSLPYIPGPLRATLEVEQKPAYFRSERLGEDLREFVRIPLQGNFNRAFNTLANTVSSDASNTEGYLDAVDSFLTNSSPVNVGGNTLGERATSVVASANPIIRAPFEQVANLNFFTKRPIVDENKLKAEDPLLQFDPERNSSLVKSLAEVFPEWAPDIVRSPQRLEGGIRAMTGNLLDLAKPSTLSPDNPATGANPILGRFYRTESVDTSATREAAQQAEGLTVNQNIIDANTARELERAAALPMEERRAVALRLRDEGKITEGALQALKKRIEDKVLSRGAEDRIIQGLQSSEAKARFYIQKVQEFGADKQGLAAYFKDQQEKKLLTESVMREMVRLSGTPQ